jgi:hypothetical protein
MRPGWETTPGVLRSGVVPPPRLGAAPCLRCRYAAESGKARHAALTGTAPGHPAEAMKRRRRHAGP